MHGSGQGHGIWRRRNPGNAGIWAGAWKMEEVECMDLGRWAEAWKMEEEEEEEKEEEKSRECRDLGRGMEDGGGGGMQGFGQGHGTWRRRNAGIWAGA